MGLAPIKMISRTSLIINLLRQGSDPAQILVRLALRRALLGCETVVDVGCGVSPVLRQLELPRLVGFDAYAPSIAKAKQLNTHDEFVQGDVRKLAEHFQPKQFDACVSMDVIEHLPKPEGYPYLKAMESIARKRVVVFTPSGFLPQGHTDADDFQTHLSGWEAQEMEALGYRVFGLLGPKKWRGEYHALKGRPKALWGILSLIAHFASTGRNPQKAAAILCVKTLDGAR
jgi:hypothetical protein